MRLSPRTGREARAIRRLVIDIASTSMRSPTTVLVGFDWQGQFAVGDLTDLVSRDLLTSVQRNLCYRAVLHIGARNELGRYKAHVLEIGGDERAYALNVSTDKQTAYWCLPNEIIVTALREVART